MTATERAITWRPRGATRSLAVGDAPQWRGLVLPPFCSLPGGLLCASERLHAGRHAVAGCGRKRTVAPLDEGPAFRRHRDHGGAGSSRISFGNRFATVFGAAVGYSRRAGEYLDPTLQALKAVPSLAWVPLFILWFGIFEVSKIALIAVGVFFPVYLNLLPGSARPIANWSRSGASTRSGVST